MIVDVISGQNQEKQGVKIHDQIKRRKDSAKTIKKFCVFKYYTHQVSALRGMGETLIYRVMYVFLGTVSSSNGRRPALGWNLPTMVANPSRSPPITYET